MHKRSCKMEGGQGVLIDRLENGQGVLILNTKIYISKNEN